MEDKVYKIFTETEWNQFQETGRFRGSADDLRDGFIHLCTEKQIPGVIERFFSGRPCVYVAEFSDVEFIRQLKWEASAANEIYPHLYGHDLCSKDISSFKKL